MSDIVPPCDCAELVDGQFVSRCYCSNRDDGERTAAWCVEANYKAAADYDRCTIEFLRKEAAEAATRITQLEAEVERLLRYNEDRELAARDMADTAAARIEQLEAENASLASWQCEFTDGKTGLVYGEGGSTYCAMAKRVQKLEAALRAVMDDLTLIGENHWLPVGLLDDVIYVNALAALEEPK